MECVRSLSDNNRNHVYVAILCIAVNLIVFMSCLLAFAILSYVASLNLIFSISSLLSFSVHSMNKGFENPHAGGNWVLHCPVWYLWVDIFNAAA